MTLSGYKCLIKNFLQKSKICKNRYPATNSALCGHVVDIFKFKFLQRILCKVFVDAKSCCFVLPSWLLGHYLQSICTICRHFCMTRLRRAPSCCVEIIFKIDFLKIILWKTFGAMKRHFVSVLLLQLKPLNVIALGESESNNINQMITISGFLLKLR
jgi:hypothetical protein